MQGTSQTRIGELDSLSNYYATRMVVWAELLTVLRVQADRVFKHVRRSQQNPQGGRLEKEMPVSAANVMLVCSACGELARTGVRYLDDGSKERFCKKCSKGNGQIAPPKTAYAK